MSKKKKTKEEILRKIRNLFYYSSESYVYQKYRTNYDKYLKALSGEPWDKKVMDLMEADGIIPFHINTLSPIINDKLSLQINARRRIAFKAPTGTGSSEVVADVLNNLLYYIQTKNDCQNETTKKYEDSLVGGIGWGDFGYNPNNETTFFYNRADPREVYWDPDDTSPRMDKSNFVCRSYFLSAEALKIRYPEHAKYFDEMIGDDDLPKNSDTVADNKYLYSIYNSSITENDWVVGRTARIVEVYYKEIADYYEVIVELEPEDPNSQPFTQKYFRTFDKELAESKMVKGTEMKVKTGTKIWKGVFSDQLLLESGVLAAQVPNQKHFPLIPLCLYRDHENVPVGILAPFMPLATAKDYLLTRTMHTLSSKYLIISNNDTDKEAEREELFKEISSRNGIIFSKNPRDAQLITNDGILPYLENVSKRIDVEIQQASRVYDELIGEKTNAISGVAINARANNSARNQNTLQVALNHMLISEGNLILNTIRGIKDFSPVIQYYRNDNLDYAKIIEEIVLMDFEVTADLAPNYTSSSDERQDRFDSLVANPRSDLLFSSIKFLESSGCEEQEALELHEAYKQAMQQSAQGQTEEQAQMEEQGVQE